ncbi:MAG: hypothetical protein Kow0068_26380 [Marinilabiliales bacterium]
MKLFLLLAICLFIPITVLTQENIIIKNRWSNWETDTVKYDGKMNFTKKRIKITSNNCLITEEIIFFHDECGNIIRKTKIRSDCKRNIGEGNIIYERKYKRKCDK